MYRILYLARCFSNFPHKIALWTSLLHSPPCQKGLGEASVCSCLWIRQLAQCNNISMRFQFPLFSNSGIQLRKQKMTASVKLLLGIIPVKEEREKGNGFLSNSVGSLPSNQPECLIVFVVFFLVMTFGPVVSVARLLQVSKPASLF